MASVTKMIPTSSPQRTKFRNERSGQKSELGGTGDSSTPTAIVEAIAVDDYLKSSSPPAASSSLPLTVVEGERSRKWPKSLQKAVISSFKRKPDDRKWEWGEFYTVVGVPWKPDPNSESIEIKTKFIIPRQSEGIVRSQPGEHAAVILRRPKLRTKQT